jgi:hypothetical protein
MVMRIASSIIPIIPVHRANGRPAIIRRPTPVPLPVNIIPEIRPGLIHHYFVSVV